MLHCMLCEPSSQANSLNQKYKEWHFLYSTVLTTRQSLYRPYTVYVVAQQVLNSSLCICCTRYPDRYVPSGFYGATTVAPPFIQGDVLQVYISSADAVTTRPAAFASTFYSTQGRAYQTNPTVTPGTALTFYTSAVLPCTFVLCGDPCLCAFPLDAAAAFQEWHACCFGASHPASDPHLTGRVDLAAAAGIQLWVPASWQTTSTTSASLNRRAEIWCIPYLASVL